MSPPYRRDPDKRDRNEKDMTPSDATLKIAVDAETCRVTVDGKDLWCESAKRRALARWYFLL